MRQPSPSRSARARREAASEPDSASVSAKAPDAHRAQAEDVTLALLRRPVDDDGSVAALVCTATVTPTPASARESSSRTRMYERKSAPAPPRSSGTQTPMSPSSAKRSYSSRGKRCSRSHSAACGSISASANSRVSVLISRCSAELELHPGGEYRRFRRPHRPWRRSGAGRRGAWLAVAKRLDHERIELALRLADDLGARLLPACAERYGRSLVIASSASATANARAERDVGPDELVGIAPPSHRS